MKRTTASFKPTPNSTWRRLLPLALLLAGFVCTAPAAFAQATAEVSGTVQDSTGAVIPKATVTLKSVETGATRSYTANSAGIYSFTNLQPGSYTVTATTTGFNRVTTNLVVTVGGRFTFDPKLSPSNVSTTVDVTTDTSTQINLSTPEVSQVITQTQLTEFPSLTRDPYDFVKLVGNSNTGDNTSSGNAQNGPAIRGVGVSLNGGRSSGTEILLDGVENIHIFDNSVEVRVPVDTVQEYRVITNNFSPEYGRASGGVVAVATKSGTNQFHGKVWEFNRLSATTANTVTNAQSGVAKGIYTRNQFGAFVGGPIIKDKLFFLGSTEFVRVRSAANITAAVPSAQLIAASAANIQSYYSTYAGPFTGRTISTTTNLQAGGGTTPLYSQFAPNFPVFTNVVYTTNQDAGGGLPQNAYNITGRVDYNLGSKTQMFFRYVNYTENDLPGAAEASPYSQYNVSYITKTNAYLFSFAHEFNAALSTIGKLSFTRDIVSNSYNLALQNVPTLNIAPSATDPFTLNQLYQPGFYSQNPANGGLPYGGPQNTIQYNQDVTYTVGKHQVQAGAQIIYFQENQGYGAYAQANEQLGKSQSQGFANFPTGVLYRFQVAADPHGAVPCARNPYTGALATNAACSVTLPTTSPSFSRSYRFHDSAGYVQDSFKATPSLTLNLGVRYEYFGVQHNSRPSLDSNFYYGSGSNVFQQVRNGSVLSVPNSPIKKLWNPQYGTVSPRIGFALDVFGNQKTSLRGGYGISYERNFGNVTFNVIQNPPAYAVVVQQTVANDPNQTYTVTNSNLGPLAAASGSVPLPPSSLRHVDQNIRTAQTQFHSLAIDQQLGHNTVLEVAYNGSRGIHLYDIKNYNIPGEGNLYLGDPLADPAGSINTSTGKVNTALTSPNPQFSNDNQRGSNGDSYYNAVAIQLTSQDIYHSGLSLTANYTFAHELDDLSTTFSESSAGNFELGYTNATNPALDHASGDSDIRHRFIVAPIYQTPFFKNDHGLKGQLLGGYAVSAIYSVRTGHPFTFYDTTNNNSGYQVPRVNTVTPIRNHKFNKIPNGVSGGGSNNYQLTGATTLPVNASFGNPALMGISDLGPYPSTMEARNTFRGPGAYNVDASVSKSFPIYEGIHLELRAEAFNVTNHHNLYIQESLNDGANYTGGNLQIFGRKGGIAGGASDERRFLQFAGKIVF